MLIIPDFDLKFNVSSQTVEVRFHLDPYDVNNENHLNAKMMQLIVDNKVLDRYIRLIVDKELSHNMKSSITAFLKNLVYQRALYKTHTGAWELEDFQSNNESETTYKGETYFYGGTDGK